MEGVMRQLTKTCKTKKGDTIAQSFIELFVMPSFQAVG